MLFKGLCHTDWGKRFTVVHLENNTIISKNERISSFTYTCKPTFATWCIIYKEGLHYIHKIYNILCIIYEFYIYWFCFFIEP